MQNKLFLISIVFSLFATASCRKDLTGNTILIEASTNDTIGYLRLYNSCDPGPNINVPLGSWKDFTYLGDGNASFILEKGYTEECFTVTGRVHENTDTTGVTTVDILAYYQEEGNTVGFHNIQLKRPHEQYFIRYEFRPDTYLEE